MRRSSWNSLEGTDLAAAGKRHTREDETMQPQNDTSKPDAKPYLHLLAALSISYAVMFAAMFSRVNELDNVFPSLNQVYMAGLMVAPMLIIMLVAMRSMYKNKRLNSILVVAGIVLIGLFWALVRTQGGVGNRQFLRAMISHHAGAILVCERASVTDPRIQQLCRQIIESQQQEISEMKGLLRDTR